MDEAERQRRSEENEEKIAAWIEAHWADSNCPICGDANWHAGPLVEIFLHASPTGAYFPMVPVSCLTCAFVALLHGGALGVVPLDEYVRVIKDDDPSFESLPPRTESAAEAP